MEQYFFGIIIYRETLDGEGNEKWAMAQKLGSFIECSESTCVCNISSIFHCFVTLLYEAHTFPFSCFFLLVFCSFFSFENNKMLSFLFAFLFFFLYQQFYCGGIFSFVAVFIRCLRLSSSVILVSNELDDRALFISFDIFRDSVEHSEYWTLTMCSLSSSIEFHRKCSWNL